MRFKHFKLPLFTCLFGDYLCVCVKCFFAEPLLKANLQQVAVAELAPSGWPQTTKHGGKEAPLHWVEELGRGSYLTKLAMCSHDGKPLKHYFSWLLVGWECRKDKDGSIKAFRTGMWQRRLPPQPQEAIVNNMRKVTGLTQQCLFSDHAVKKILPFWVSELCDVIPRPVLALRKNRFERYISSPPWSCLFWATPANSECQNLTPACDTHHFLLCFLLSLSEDKNLRI